ncbi:phosphotransferase [Thiomicrospira cyclica]|uniref:Aminoglycoside phosphotransferase domain-containing protein n=1 Tax=Thiomicrospira cyclica (strain DSM 14477 / JCM 11371 / ALM1) TaxID=717773 RepID=F6DCX8_THICA|nr:phosphotransferase [Thiomicrospira cyclica]AEG31714.1 hypothetical protein Thicy_0947 [Thiomicrospira cyclica ALM1]
MANAEFIKNARRYAWSCLQGVGKFYYVKLFGAKPLPLSLPRSSATTAALVDDPSYQQFIDLPLQTLDEATLQTWLSQSASPRLVAAFSKQPATWLELKDATDVAQLTNQMAHFQKLIHDFDKDLKLPNTKATFYGRGHGLDSLNVYRKLEAGNETLLFEKIYLKTGRDWLLINWFYTQVAPKLPSAVTRVPMLIDIREGQQLVAAYFEFITDPLDDLQSKNDLIQRGMAIQQILWQLTQSHPQLVTEFPIAHQQLNNIPLFAGCMNRLDTLQAQLAKQFGLELDGYWLKHQLERIEQHPKQFCHGDIHGKNLSASGWLIDWDNFSYLPVGYDIMLLLSKIQNIYCIEQLEHIIDQVNATTYPHPLSTTIKYNMMFFAAVFYARKLNERISLSTLAAILQWLARQSD